MVNISRRQLLGLAGTSATFAVGGALAGTSVADQVNARQQAAVMKHSPVRPHNKKPTWRFPVGNLNNNSFLASGSGAVYASFADILYALQADRGSVVWEFRTEQSYPATVYTAGGVVYVVAGDNPVLHALNASNGRRMWDFSIGSENPPPLILDMPFAYLTDARGYICAFDAHTGVTRWAVPSAGNVADSPALARGETLYTFSDSVIRALGKIDGSEKWSFTSPSGSLQGPPQLIRDIVYASANTEDNQTNLFALDATNGQLLWTAHVSGSATLARAVNNVICSVGDTGVVSAVDINNGITRWTKTPGELNYSPLVNSYPTLLPITAESIIVSGIPAAHFGGIADSGGADGQTTLSALHLSDGAIKWQAACGGRTLMAPPAIISTWACVGFVGGSMYGVNQHTGMIEWDLPLRVVAGPAASERMVFTVGADAVALDGTVSPDGAVYGTSL
jgi:outer membrane protein assembly factor BamB